MKIGLVPVNVGIPHTAAMLALARKAEEVGFESVWTFEHVVVPTDYGSKYPYSADGKMGVTPETNFVDPLIALAAVAAATGRLRLGTGVNILPQANPLLLAKQAASLDFVSGGRLELGLGIGWLREEFDALGAPFERRGARFDEYVEAMRKVWAGGEVEHASEHLRWSGFQSHPLPVQRPGPPIVIGGSKGKVFRRIARHGDGWFAPTVSADQLKPMLKPLAEACSAEGRKPESVEISAMFAPAAGLDGVRRYEDVGVARLIVPLQALAAGGNPIEALDAFGNDLLAKLG